MEPYSIAYITIVTFSLLLSSFVLIVHLLIPKLLRPPGDLIFCQSIAQVMIDLHWYSVFFSAQVNEDSRMCMFTGAITVFFTTFSSNCILCLCIEITFKLANRISTHNKLRRIIYYSAMISFSSFLLILAAVHGDFGYSSIGSCSLKPSSITSYIRLSNFAIDIIIQIVLIIHILKKIGKIYSKVTLNYFLVVVSDSVFIILANLLKYISYAIKDKNSKLILLQISSFIAAGTGIAIGLSRLYNKRLLSELLWKLRKKPKVSLSHSINSHQSESDSSLLMSNIYNMGDLFESITSKSLAQMLITIFIKSSEYKIEVEHENEFDEFLFNEENFRELSGELGVRSINEIFVPGLCLVEYLPSYFEEIRQDIGLSNSEFFLSFSLHENLAKMHSIKKASGGRSNATIFFTSDNKFVVKTITRKERRFFLKEIIQKYRERVKNSSFLVRIVAVFRLTPANVDYLIMENTVSQIEKAVVFDIKGSTVNRKVDVSFDYQHPRYGLLLKDLNLIESKYELVLSKEQSQEMLSTILSDLEMLHSVEATDYSILICFYQPDCKFTSRYVVQGTSMTYAISIIDFLQEFNFFKKSERLFKKIVYDSQEISVAEPGLYKLRLLKFFSDLIKIS